MTDVIDFFFTTLGQLWSVITASWVLSMAVLITVIGWVIDLVRASKQD